MYFTYIQYIIDRRYIYNTIVLNIRIFENQSRVHEPLVKINHTQLHNIILLIVKSLLNILERAHCRHIS